VAAVCLSDTRVLVAAASTSASASAAARLAPDARRRAFHPQKLAALVKQLPVKVVDTLAIAAKEVSSFANGKVTPAATADATSSSAEAAETAEAAGATAAAAATGGSGDGGCVVAAVDAQQDRLDRLQQQASEAGASGGDGVDGGTVSSSTSSSPLSSVVRSKGFVWLATHHNAAVYWSHAGTHFELKNVGTWWAACDVGTLPDGKLPGCV
jgi:hypothetical protein